MKTKTKRRKPNIKVIVPAGREKITDTTLSEIGLNIGRMMDIINDPTYRNEKFRQILSQGKNHFSISAANDDVFISFAVEYKKGGKK